MVFKSTAKDLKIRQNSRAELIAIKVDISAISDGTNAGVSEGAQYVTLTDNGTGDTTITLNDAARRNIHFVGGGCEGEGFIRISGTPDTSTIRVLCEDDAGTASDFDFFITLLVFRSETER